jgi:beta-galactosidase
MVHIVPSSWNWKTGDPIRVLAWSNAPQVELFLNGQSLGIKEVPKASHAEWQVPFAAGELTAKAINNGKIVATDTLQTTSAPAHIKLTVDRTTLTANAEDAVVVAVSLLDDKGRVVPNDDRRIKFEVTGSGKILGVNNGNPADHDSDRADNRNTFHGHCIAIVEAGDPGELRVTASSPNVTSDSLKFKVR